MIEDVIAQNHTLVDSLTFNEGVVAKSALQAIGETADQAGPFAQLLGMKFEEMAGGRCRASLQVKQHLLNPHGIAHGGVTFALADSTCGGAALSAVGAPSGVAYWAHLGGLALAIALALAAPPAWGSPTSSACPEITTASALDRWPSRTSSTWTPFSSSGCCAE